MYNPAGFFPSYHFINYGRPFSRKDFYMNISYFVEKGWGSYKELITLTMRDFAEIGIGLKSKQQEEELAKALGGG